MKKENLLCESELMKSEAQAISLKENEQINITVNSNDTNYIYVSEFSIGSILNIQLKENSKLQLSFLAKHNFDKAEINVNLENGAYFAAYFADFSKDKEKLKVTINLNGEASSAYWHLASLSANNDNKEFNVNVNHLAFQTSALSDNYGVCKDQSKLIFSGCSAILKGSHGSHTRQNSKIMVFDESCDAIARPLLKIDEKDIEASHGAVVGRIPEDHLFYLTSRGLDEYEAKRLITYGYLKPITRGFFDESIREEIVSLIERRM